MMSYEHREIGFSAGIEDQSRQEIKRCKSDRMRSMGT